MHFVMKRGRKRKRTCWRKTWIAGHDDKGAYNNLIDELELDGSLRNWAYLRK